jgi:hypothetical protein
MIDCLQGLFMGDGIKRRPRHIIQLHVGLGRNKGETRGSS